MHDNLRALREDNDIKQKEMAELLKVHQTTYSDYKRGELNIPVDVLLTLAEYFHTSIDYILGLTDERKPYPRKKR